MRTERDTQKNKGFTLVELIVVLVILAILAAVLVPALIGYIDKARQRKYQYNARACYDAAQAMFSELYGTQGPVADGTPVVGGAQVISESGNEDQDITNTAFAKNLLKLAGIEGTKKPYCLLIGVGSSADNNKDIGAKVSNHDKYTVFYVFYMEEENTTPYYFYNGEWTETNPRFEGSNTQTEIFDKNNVVKKGPMKGKRIQYYLISNYTGKGSFEKNSKLWTWLKKMK